MTAELWLIRHGQTDWNLEGRYQGHADIPLNATGLEQARALANFLDGSHFDAIFCSDLQRARQTADILSQRFALPVTIDLRLREIDQGEWEGKLLKDVVALYENMDQHHGSASFRPPGGESVAEVTERMVTATDEIVRCRPGQKILLVSHGLALATLVCHAQAIPLEKVYDHIPQNAHPTVLTWKT